MKIGKLHLKEDDKLTIASVEVEFSQGNQKLWYSIDKSFSHLISTKSDSFLLALLIPAMANGEDIYIEGTVSEVLLHNLSSTYQKILKLTMPSLNLIKIHPTTASSERDERPKGVATGFSGGIDSYCVLSDHFHSDVSDSFKITHLLFNNVGSHGTGGEKLFHERYQDLLPVTESLGLPFLMIDSNLDSFYGKNFFFAQTHTPRNVSVALLLQNGISSYFYASSVSYKEAFVGKTEKIAYSDSISLPLLKTETLEPISTSSQYTRVEKTLKVANIPESYYSLDICVRPRSDTDFKNCGSCWKCLRTLVTLEIAGLLDRYSKVFDLYTYGNNREQYMSKLLGSKDLMHIEVIEFADENGFLFPAISRFKHKCRYYPIKDFSGRASNKIKKTELGQIKKI
ncbi:hypothetical protein [Marinobacter sp.]|uniref:hypothetical protein n=1 Tax=Marinobacter sp. TaxID=50741 RepID=UPI003850568C